MAHPTRAGIAAIAGILAASPALAQQTTAQSLIEDCASEPNLQLENACLRNALTELEARMSPAQRQAAASPAPAPGVQGLGAEQVMARQGRRQAESTDETGEAAEAVVVDISQTSGGDYIFVLDNDQVWAQQDFDMNTDLRLDEDRDYRVEIVKGFLSGYRLRLLDEDRLLKVERLR